MFFLILFLQHIVEGLLNSWRRVSDRPSWILISKTPARKSTNIVVVVFFLFPKRIKGCIKEILTKMPYSLLFCKLRRNPSLGTETLLLLFYKIFLFSAVRNFLFEFINFSTGKIFAQEHQLVLVKEKKAVFL